MTVVRVLALPCADELLAESFAGWLRSNEVTVNGIDGSGQELALAPPGVVTTRTGKTRTARRRSRR